MLISAVILFLLAATFGLVILTAVLQERATNNIALLLHGSLATIAILLMITSLLMYGAAPLLIASLVLFILAALGGITLFILDKQKKPIPKLLAILHPLVAVAGLIVLVVYILP